MKRDQLIAKQHDEAIELALFEKLKKTSERYRDFTSFG